MGKFDRRLARGQHAQGAKASVTVSGISAPAQRKFEARSDGTVATQFVIQIGELPPPERRYSAEEAFLTFNGRDAVLFHFIQRKANGVVRSLVTVKMYSDSARQYHDTLDVIAEPLEQFVERVQLQVPRVEPPDGEPDHSVSVVASVAQTTFGGYEAEMSFYHVSPYGLHVAAMKNMENVPIEPVVRVDLPTVMLVGIVRQLSGLISQLPRSNS